MTKPATVLAPKYRTPAQLRADAAMLAGTRSRVALAAAGDDAPEPETGTVAELWLYGVVGGWWRGFDAESVSRALREIDADVIYVRIHSPGGVAYDGVAISNLLRNHRAKIVVVVDGLAASAASVIAIAGDEIVMCPGSQMMLHDASTGMYGNEAELHRAAVWIGGQSRNYAGVYAGKAGGTPEQWREVMLANDGWGTWYTAEEAVAAGLADSVGNRIAIGSPPVAPEDEFDELDEEMLARAAHDLQILEQNVHPAARAAWQGERPKPPTASAGGSVTTEGGPAVAFSDEQLTTMRDKLELPADADEAAIVAAVAAVVEENLEERPASPTAAVTPGDVVVPEVRLRDLEAAAAAGVAAAKKLHDMERDAFLDANKTKFPATSRADWATRFDKDPEGTRELLSAAADLVPTGEHGHGDAPDGTEGPTSLAEIREDPTYKNWEI
ncbi:head maturation protease, ClpP-related [Nocardioides sp.]|uniref:head maturation protease, ClpP-related n=1 Tax=Nocardioides sp. TaxID=35761 RepID=UPI00262102DE|nr:head maturation protease, ClpP-related [Nocardioides sp.]MDI6911472.1 Clp protease ClpP [Nocardioides sp.]